MQVNIIPATKRHVQNSDQFSRAKSLRVAAYCRVSTEAESQQNSYATQKSYYSCLILSRPGWEIAGIYADEGKSGTTRKSRIHFNQMMEDAKAGKIDYIITKSISRFARNTVDALDCVHELQCLRPPVGVYFERERIDTLNQNSEMFLTFYCSMAQEESHSISENIRWSIRKKMAAGEPQINLRRMLGYDQCKNGDWIINEEQAETVRYIYERFLRGISANQIAQELKKQGKATVNGGSWRADTVLGILRNEKYAGDLLMQKTYTESYLTHKAVKNTGEVEQYFKADHHPAIIDRESWNKTQELLRGRRYSQKRTSRTIHTEMGDVVVETSPQDDKNSTGEHIVSEKKSRRGTPSSPFDGMVCACCGESFQRLTYHCAANHYTDERVNHEIKQGEENYKDFFDFAYGVWKCKSTSKSGTDKKCEMKALVEFSIEQSFMEMLYRIKRDYLAKGENSEIVRSFQQVYTAICQREVNSGFIEQKLELLQMEIEKLDKAYRETCQKRETAAYAASINLVGIIGDGLWQNNISIPGSMITSDSITIPGTGIQYENLANDLKVRLEEKRTEYRQLLEERGVATKLKLNFESFLKALKALPDTNEVGMTLNVNTLDTNGSIFRTSDGERRGRKKSQYDQGHLKITQEIINQSPDYLHFDEYYLRTYFLGMTVHGDEIHYITTFGLTLTSTGNTRGIKSYIGYRKTNENGEAELITESYQIARGSIQHHWRKR